MRIGLTMYLQNYDDWGRHLALEAGEDAPAFEPNTDASIWAEEIDAIQLVEEQGFDSIWTVEHHVSPYTMVPNPLQLLSFVAGATSRIDVGTMVVVVPWHNPLRVAEDITMLQHLLRGRRVFLGMGRGLGRREYKALGVDQNESRERFKEGVEVIKLALTQEQFSYDGEIHHYDRTMMRPRPRDAQQLVDDLCFSWGSPTSAPIGASLGLRPLIIPQKAFEEYHADLAAFGKARAEIGLAPVRPRIHLHMYCDADEDRAREVATRTIGQYANSASLNYELAGAHFNELKGYEHYAQMGAVSQDAVDKAWIDNCIWGTPDQCIEKITRLCEVFHPAEFMLTGRFGNMPRAVSARSLDLFAREVLPAVHEIKEQEPIGYETVVS
ncbi:LLM class flavin-dependent oxidoreductase [Sciscionella marina]|uniref:LLM class flavin-dependent oxidoreductase n=1 Tax=Sciscionella marina TaxID=508770 RepID=UPI00036E3505|nr:LLM class flavin-dependent oxidoreductase [Sciscionella marina]